MVREKTKQAKIASDTEQVKQSEVIWKVFGGAIIAISIVSADFFGAISYLISSRKLLAHKEEINKMRGYVERKGYTLVPTEVYLKKGLVKVKIALAKGKELHDKRSVEHEKQQKRNIERAVKEYNS